MSGTASALKVQVKEAKSVTKGTHVLSLQFAGGYSTSVSYIVKLTLTGRFRARHDFLTGRGGRESSVLSA